MTCVNICGSAAFSILFSHKCTILCKNRSTNTREVYNTKSILPIIASVKAMTLQRQLKKLKASITLHEYPPLRLLLHSNIAPIPIWRSSIPTVATIVSVSVITGRITRVAVPIISGRVVLTTVAIPIRVRCVVST